MLRGKLLQGFSALALLFLVGTAQAQNNTVIIQDPAAAPSPPATTPDTVTVTPVPPDTMTYVNPADDTVGGIQPGEEKVLQRRKVARNYTGVGLGPAGFTEINEETPSYNFYLGQFWEVNSRAAIKGLAEATTDLDDNHFFNFNLGANFYMLPNDFSPYLGGDLGLGLMRHVGDNTFGFNVGGSVGAMLFRTSTAQMNLEANANLLMAEIDNGAGDDDDFPTVYSARIGVMF